jgi:choline-sulfatase
LFNLDQQRLFKGKWKLCYGHGNPPELELYNLEEDPGEFQNIAYDSQYKSIREELMNKILSYWGTLKS